MKKILVAAALALYSSSVAGQIRGAKQSVDFSLSGAHYQGALALSFVNEWTMTRQG